MISCEPVEETIAVCEEFQQSGTLETTLIKNHHRLQLAPNTLQALLTGYKRMGNDDCNMHIEDDTVLSPDSLTFIEFIHARWASNPKCLSYTLHNRKDGRPDTYAQYDHFTVQNWATSLPKLKRILVNWCNRRPGEYGWRVQEMRKAAGQFEIRPCLSRIQNIGIHGGQHAMTEERFMAQIHVPHVCKTIHKEWKHV